MSVDAWMDIVGDRLAAVRAEIASVAAGCGRDPAGVRLIAVSKRHPPEAIEAAYRLGQREFGENYAQELVEKVDALSHLPELRMRFIGHLQRNKAKALLPHCAAVDTVDSLRLATALASKAGESSRRLEVLIQVNVAGEVQKAGVSPSEVAELVEGVRAMPALDLRGLMTVPPASGDPEASRPHFARLRSLAERHGLSELSMGMTADMRVAIEEGATMVRVGTAIFGER